MRTTARVLLLAALLVGCRPEMNMDILNDIQKLEAAGEFRVASDRVDSVLATSANLDSGTARLLRWEKERMFRIRKDYGVEENRMREILHRNIKGFTDEEFVLWQQQQRFDSRVIDGEKRFINPSLSNLFFRYPELRARRNGNERFASMAEYCLQQMQVLKTLPADRRISRRCRVRQSVTVDTLALAPGKKVTCWLPYAMEFEDQDGGELLRANPGILHLAPARSPIRSAFFETVMPEKNPLVFSVEYEYNAHTRFRDIQPEAVQPFDENETEWRNFTREEKPHGEFIPELQEKVAELTGDEKNPLLRARAIYDWISKNIRYSYAREYSTIRNISKYTFEHRYGDCGQEALLFITMCRIAGVPARWQSGFMTFPGNTGMHDWTEIYIKPYGWLPVDPYMGIFFHSVIENLTSAQREELRSFYFGNIDYYRLVVNKDHNLPLTPAKKYFRSEPVDFQRGEVEWEGGNLYFNEWDWSLSIEEI